MESSCFFFALTHKGEIPKHGVGWLDCAGRIEGCRATRSDEGRAFLGRCRSGRACFTRSRRVAGSARFDSKPSWEYESREPRVEPASHSVRGWSCATLPESSSVPMRCWGFQCFWSQSTRVVLGQKLSTRAQHCVNRSVGDEQADFPLSASGRETASWKREQPWDVGP